MDVDSSKAKFIEKAGTTDKARLVATFLYLALKLLEIGRIPESYISKFNKALYLLNSNFYFKRR
jgi:hypothetical protein